MVGIRSHQKKKKKKKFKKKIKKTICEPASLTVCNISIKFWLGINYFYSHQPCMSLLTSELSEVVQEYSLSSTTLVRMLKPHNWDPVCTDVQARNCENPELRVVLRSLKVWCIWSSASFQLSDKLAAVFSNATDNFWNPNFNSDTSLLSPQSFKIFDRYTAHIHLLIT